MNDYQKNKVYKWERINIAIYDNTKIPFNQIESIVNHIWNNEGLVYPPKVKPFPRKDINACADATRMVLRFHENDFTSTWIILHELAHAMNANVDGGSDWHCKDFVGTYILLVSKYLNISLTNLIVSAKDAKIKYRIGNVSVF